MIENSENYENSENWHVLPPLEKSPVRQYDYQPRFGQANVCTVYVSFLVTEELAIPYLLDINTAHNARMGILILQ